MQAPTSNQCFKCAAKGHSQVGSPRYGHHDAPARHCGKGERYWDRPLGGAAGPGLHQQQRRGETPWGEGGKAQQDSHPLTLHYHCQGREEKPSLSENSRAGCLCRSRLPQPPAGLAGLTIRTPRETATHTAPMPQQPALAQYTAGTEQGQNERVCRSRHQGPIPVQP